MQKVCIIYSSCWCAAFFHSNNYKQKNDHHPNCAVLHYNMHIVLHCNLQQHSFKMASGAVGFVSVLFMFRLLRGFCWKVQSSQMEAGWKTFCTRFMQLMERNPPENTESYSWTHFLHCYRMRCWQAEKFWIKSLYFMSHPGCEIFKMTLFQRCLLKMLPVCQWPVQGMIFGIKFGDIAQTFLWFYSVLLILVCCFSYTGLVFSSALSHLVSDFQQFSCSWFVI